jgi:hypothetical protein
MYREWLIDNYWCVVQGDTVHWKHATEVMQGPCYQNTKYLANRLLPVHILCGGSTMMVFLFWKISSAMPKAHQNICLTGIQKWHKTRSSRNQPKQDSLPAHMRALQIVSGESPKGYNYCSLYMCVNFCCGVTWDNYPQKKHVHFPDFKRLKFRMLVMRSQTVKSNASQT